MAHNTTVFRQLLDLLPRHEFDAEARRHQKGQRLRVMSRWAQFVALGLGQLAGLQSLRDIVGSLRAQPHKLYHLGVRAFVSRSSLARVNTEQPYTLYETLFGRLLARCQQRAPRHGFRFKNKLFAVDASTIDLCLAAFPWASFRRTKGAIKLHVGLDQAGHLPTFKCTKLDRSGRAGIADFCHRLIANAPPVNAHPIPAPDRRQSPTGVATLGGKHVDPLIFRLLARRRSLRTRTRSQNPEQLGCSP